MSTITVFTPGTKVLVTITGESVPGTIVESKVSETSKISYYVKANPPHQIWYCWYASADVQEVAAAPWKYELFQDVQCCNGYKGVVIGRSIDVTNGQRHYSVRVQKMKLQQYGYSGDFVGCYAPDFETWSFDENALAPWVELSPKSTIAHLEAELKAARTELANAKTRWNAHQQRIEETCGRKSNEIADLKQQVQKLSQETGTFECGFVSGVDAVRVKMKDIFDPIDANRWTLDQLLQRAKELKSSSSYACAAEWRDKYIVAEAKLDAIRKDLS